MKKYRYIVVAKPRLKSTRSFVRHEACTAPDGTRWPEEEIRTSLCAPLRRLGEPPARYFMTLAEAEARCRAGRRAWPAFRYKVFRVERVL